MRTSRRESAPSWPPAATTQPTCATRAWRAPHRPPGLGRGRGWRAHPHHRRPRRLRPRTRPHPRTRTVGDPPAPATGCRPRSRRRGSAPCQPHRRGDISARCRSVHRPHPHCRTRPTSPAPLRATDARHVSGPADDKHHVMLRYAAKRAASCSRSTHQQYKSLHLWPAKPLVEAAVYDFQHIPKPCVVGSNPTGGTA
jgi:hypothetical protein